MTTYSSQVDFFFFFLWWGLACCFVSVWQMLTAFLTLNPPTLPLSLSLSLLCLLPSLSVLLLNPVILSISLSSHQTLTLPLCLPANLPHHPLSSFRFLLSWCPRSPSHPPPLNHSHCNVNSNCLVREDSTVPIMPKALRRT